MAIHMQYGLKVRNVGVQIHAKIIEEEAEKQVRFCEGHPAFKELIAIMPDVHAGAGCVIGFTGKFDKAVIPNIVGVDIGCGVAAYPLKKKIRDINFENFDRFAREKIPLGFNGHSFSSVVDFYSFLQKEYAPTDIFVSELTQLCLDVHSFYTVHDVKISSMPHNQLGTLGGGNHFIEIDENPTTKQKYLVVHTGSRNFGLKVANHFQKKAKTLCKEMGIVVPTDMEYLPMSAGGNEYMEWMQLAQKYARFNRRIMLSLLLRFFNMNFREDKLIESTHNYISERDHIIRKGAISAYKDQRVIIPMNMADGIIIGTGKSNRNYNFSAPHGAGRLFGRKDIKRRLASGEFTIKQFKKSMEGVFSTSVGVGTFDESPFAYKKKEDVLEFIKETVDIEAMLKPIYNLKNDEKS